MDDASLGRPSSRRALRGILLPLVLATCWALAFVWRSTSLASDGQRYPSLADDAMISMRYAWHLANGEGLVYNPGERVEGYSNLLWTLFMSSAIAVFGQAGGVVAVQFAGLGLWLATALALPRVVAGLCQGRADDDPGTSDTASVSAVVLVLACYPLAHWSLLGMEVALLAFALTLALGIACNPQALSERGPAALLGGLLAVLVLARTDVVPVCAVLLAFLFASRASRRTAIVAAAAGLLALLGHTAFRLAYYGDWVPNTARLKLEGIPLESRLENGWLFLAPFLFCYAPVLGLCIFAAMRRHQRAAWLIVAVVTVQLLYQVWVGGDAFPHWRMIAPVLPAALALAAAEIHWLVSRAAVRLECSGRAALAKSARTRLGVLLAAMLALLTARSAWPEVIFLDEPAAVAYSRAHVELFVKLRSVLRDGASLGVIFAGTLPYYGTRWRVVDLLGKTDSHIARLAPDLSGAESWFRLKTVPGHNKYDLRHSILGRRPTYVESSRWGAQAVPLSGRYVQGWLGGRSLLLRAGDASVDWSALDTVLEIPGPRANAVNGDAKVRSRR